MNDQRKSRVPILIGLFIAIVIASLAGWWFSPGHQRKRQADALASAAAHGDVAGVEAALAAGADVNARDADGVTPLMQAARGDHPDIANPAPTDHPDVLELLIQRGADVNARTDTGFVALFWAARYGHAGAAKALIDHGADVNAREKDGLTAVAWARTNKQTKVIDLLQSAGAKE